MADDLLRSLILFTNWGEAARIRSVGRRADAVCISLGTRRLKMQELQNELQQPIQNERFTF
jgi:hypothetical protein